MISYTPHTDLPPVYLSVRGNNYISNNSEILITEIGDDFYSQYLYGYLDAELTCHTDLQACCRAGDTGTVGMGEWHYPNGSIIPNRAAGEDFFRLRNSPQAIKLARLHDIDGNGALGPTGLYCCVIPTSIGEQTFCAHLCKSNSIQLTYIVYIYLHDNHTFSLSTLPYSTTPTGQRNDYIQPP